MLFALFRQYYDSSWIKGQILYFGKNSSSRRLKKHMAFVRTFFLNLGPMWWYTITKFPPFLYNYRLSFSVVSDRSLIHKFAEASKSSFHFISQTWLILTNLLSPTEFLQTFCNISWVAKLPMQSLYFKIRLIKKTSENICKDQHLKIGKFLFSTKTGLFVKSLHWHALETFQPMWKVSKQSGNCPDHLSVSIYVF